MLGGNSTDDPQYVSRKLCLTARCLGVSKGIQHLAVGHTTYEKNSATSCLLSAERATQRSAGKRLEGAGVITPPNPSLSGGEVTASSGR